MDESFGQITEFVILGIKTNSVSYNFTDYLVFLLFVTINFIIRLLIPVSINQPKRKDVSDKWFGTNIGYKLKSNIKSIPIKIFAILLFDIFCINHHLQIF